MLRSGLISFSALLLLSTAVYADVFKYVDEKGNVQYTDRPPKLPAERLNVQSQRTDMVQLQERADDEAKALAEREKARKQNNRPANDKASSAETTASKAELCSKARQDYLSRMNAQRLYEEQPNGERRYLSDAEMDATRASAKKAMDDLCN